MFIVFPGPGWYESIVAESSCCWGNANLERSNPRIELISRQIMLKSHVFCFHHMSKIVSPFSTYGFPQMGVTPSSLEGWFHGKSCYKWMIADLGKSCHEWMITRGASYFFGDLHMSALPRRGLSYLHSANVVHQRLRPRSVLVNRTLGRRRSKIVDQGNHFPQLHSRVTLHELGSAVMGVSSSS